MKFYKKSGEDTICTLCQHYCKIKEGHSGICGVNKNVGSEIACLVYGYPASLAVDPIEKKPLYHFLPGSKIFSLGTVGCNFHCSFCQNWQLSQETDIDTSTYYSPQEIVELAIANGCPSIAYTYNEPTVFYPYARNIAIEAKKQGIKSVFVSNGFQSSEVIEDMAGIYRVNLGTGKGYSVLEVVKAVEAASGRTVKYEVSDRRPGDVAACYADPAHAKEFLGWEAERDLDCMCRDGWNWQSKNPDGYSNVSS